MSQQERTVLYNQLYKQARINPERYSDAWFRWAMENEWNRVAFMEQVWGRTVLPTDLKQRVKLIYDLFVAYESHYPGYYQEQKLAEDRVIRKARRLQASADEDDEAAADG